MAVQADQDEMTKLANGQPTIVRHHAFPSIRIELDQDKEEARYRFGPQPTQCAVAEGDGVAAESIRSASHKSHSSRNPTQTVSLAARERRLSLTSPSHRANCWQSPRNTENFDLLSVIGHR
jgi:hypothetical protein